MIAFLALAAVAVALVAVIAALAFMVRAVGRLVSSGRAEREEWLHHLREQAAGDRADRQASDSRHREERERYMRAIIAKSVPEFRALEQVIAGEPAHTPPRGRRSFGLDEVDPAERDPFMPANPEGL